MDWEGNGEALGKILVDFHVMTDEVTPDKN